MKNLLKKYFQKVGLYLQLKPKFYIYYFPTASSFFNHIQQIKGVEAQEKELKHLLNFVVIAKNHSFYHKILQLFVPHWKWKNQLENPVFLSKESKISSNRKITIENKKYFEKLYFSTGHELKTLLWSQKNLYNILNEKFDIPQLQKLFKGDFIHLVYFNFISTTPLTADQTQLELLKISIDFYELSKKYSNELKKLDWPEILVDDEKLFFEKNIQKAKKALQKQGLNYSYLKEKINRLPKIIAHADLHRGNVFKNEILVDLDNIGFYALGLDPAFIYTFHIENQPQEQPIFDWLTFHYRSKIKSEEWEGFVFGFAFYAYLYLLMRPQKSRFKEVENQLLHRLKSSASSF